MNYTSKGFVLPEGSEFFSKDHANFNAQKTNDLIVALEKRPILSKSAAYTVIADDLNKTITVTGDTTITLTAIAALGIGFRCRVSNIGVGVVSVVPSGADTIAKGTGITIYPGKCVEVVADYAGMWTVVGFDFTEIVNSLGEQINSLAAVKACKAFNNTAQSIPAGVNTMVAFNTNMFDTDNIHDIAINNTRFTCKTAGKYLIVGQIRFASNATNNRAIGIKLNGGATIAYVGQPANPTGSTGLQAVTVYELAVGDYVELFGFQNSSGGGALDLIVEAYNCPILQMVKVA